MSALTNSHTSTKYAEDAGTKYAEDAGRVARSMHDQSTVALSCSYAVEDAARLALTKT